MFESCRAHHINNLQPLISPERTIVNNFVRDRRQSRMSVDRHLARMAGF